MIISLESRAVVPHSFFADPDPAVFLNADLDPGGKMNADPCGSGSILTNFVKSKLMKSFYSRKKHKKITLKYETMELCANLLKKFNEIAVISNFLAFFQFLVEKFSLLDSQPCSKALFKGMYKNYKLISQFL